MLQGMRRAGQGWIGKTIVAILFGLLIVSFGLWGISDIFRGYGRNTVAKVGDVEISSEAMRTAYQNELQRYTRTFRQAFTPERAKALGIDTFVFNRLVNEAALDQRAAKLGLGISDDKVRQAILDEPLFKGIGGSFDRGRFDDILRSSGFSEASFVREQRATMVRQQLVEALAGGLSPPLTVREAAYRHGAERRSVNYFILPTASAGDVPAPGEAELKAFFEERKSSFRASEYRKINLLVMTADGLAKPAEIGEDAARARYEKDKTAKHGSPERRKLQQIRFPNDAEAQAASDKLKSGMSFEDLAKEMNVSAKDIDLGILSKSEVADASVRDVAFALPESGVTAPISSRFGPVIVRVEAIEPETVKPYEEVADQVKRDIALERAKAELGALHDKIEEQRSAAKTLAQIAPDFGLTLRTIESVDNDGQDKSEKDVADLPQKSALLSAVFASDVGADNEALRIGDGGYVWFDVVAVEPARDRALDEVHDEVTAAWRTEEISRRLAAKARELVTRLDQGEPFAAIAAAAGQDAKAADGLARGQPKDDITSEALTRIFGTPAGKAGTVALDEGERRLVFQVASATVPAFDPKSADATRLDEQLKTAMADDLRQEFVKQLQQELGVTVNPQALRNALGGASTDN